MKILIIGPSWVGDMVMAQSLFIRLREDRPDCIIDVLAPAWSRPLLERMPQVRRGIDMPVGHGSLQWDVRREIGKQLSEEGYDQAIILPNSLKSALIPWFAGIPKRTGWHGEMRYGLLSDRRKLDKAAFPLMVDRFVALAYPRETMRSAADIPVAPPKPCLQVDAAQAGAAMERFALGGERPILVLCPGAEFGEAKRWPEYHYAEVARQRIADGWQVWLLGSEKDQTCTAAIRETLSEERRPSCFDLAGRTSLAEAIDLISRADAVVSNDSGLMHIAAAQNRPLVVLYGSSSPKFTPPMSDRVQVLSLDLECSPCFKRTCPLEHLHCLTQLMPERVLAALDDLRSAA